MRKGSADDESEKRVNFCLCVQALCVPMSILLLISWTVTLFNERKAVRSGWDVPFGGSCPGRLVLDSVLSQGEDA